MATENPQQEQTNPAIVEQISDLVESLLEGQEHTVMGFGSSDGPPYQPDHPHLPPGMSNLDDARRYMESRSDFQDRLNNDPRFRDIYEKLKGLLARSGKVR